MAQMIHFLTELKKRWNSLEGSLFPYALTSSLVMTLAPALVVIVVLFSQDEVWMNQMIQTLMRFLPEELVVSALDYFSTKSPAGMSFYLFLAVAVWIASKSPAHFLMLNKKEHDSQIPVLMLRLLSIWITVEMMLIMFGMAVLIRFFRVQGVIASEMLLMIGVLWFYRSVSLKRYSWKEGWPGALIAFFGINGIGLFFFFYINEIASTHVIYGPLSSLVIVLLSCFVVSNVIFLGYSSNEILRDGKESISHYPMMEKLGEKTWKYKSRKRESTEKE